MTLNLTFSPTGTSVVTPGVPDGVLLSSQSQGDTTLTLTATPDATFNKAGLIIGVGWGKLFEAHEVSSLSGAAFTLANPLHFNHAAGDPVFIIRDGFVNPFYYAGTISGDPDFSVFQRMLYECFEEGVGVDGTTNGAAAPHQQLMFPNPSFLGVQNVTLAAANAGWIGGVESATKLHSAANIVCKWAGRFTSSGTTITWPYTTNSSLQLAANNEVLFNDPYGKADGSGSNLPSGINPGQIYYVKTTPTGNTITIAATIGGTAITVGTGSGIGYSGMGGLGKVRMRNFHTNNQVTGLHGWFVCAQQLSYLEHLQALHQGGSGTYAVVVGPGQGLYMEDWNLQTTDLTSRCLYMTGASLMQHKGYLNMISNASDNVVADFDNNFSIEFDGIWCETAGNINLNHPDSGTNRKLSFGQMYGTCIQDKSSTVSQPWGTDSWDYDGSEVSGGGSPTATGYDHTGTLMWYYESFSAGGELGHGAADTNQNGPGVEKKYNAPPNLKTRVPTPSFTLTSSGDSLPVLYEKAFIDTTSTNPWILVIDKQDIFGGNAFKFQRVAGANAIRLTPESPKTIDGAATKDYNDNLEHCVQTVAATGNLVTLY